METYLKLLAFVLFYASSQDPVPVLPPAIVEAVYPYVQELAIDDEVMDKNELVYLLSRPETFAHDVALIRIRREEFKYMPRLAETSRFPDKRQVDKAKAFNRQYMEKVEFEIGIANSNTIEYWQDAKNETQKLWKVWDLLSDIQTDYYFVMYRRQALDKYREAVGWDQYMTVELPPFVPYWRFRRFDQ